MILDFFFLSDCLSPVHFVLMGFYLIPFLEHISLLPHFAEFVIFISMNLVACLCFPTLEMWPFLGDILWIPATHTLWSAKLYSLGVPCVLTMWAHLLLWADRYGQPGRCGWSPVWLVSRPCLFQRLPTTGEWARPCGCWFQGSRALDASLAHR